MEKKTRRLRLDGKPPSRPRGRHAVPRSEGEVAPKPVPVPLPARLGYRVNEFAALLGVSPPHVWRGIANEEIETVDVNGVVIIPRAFAIKQGLITKDDGI